MEMEAPVSAAIAATRARRPASRTRLVCGEAGGRERRAGRGQAQVVEGGLALRTREAVARRGVRARATVAPVSALPSALAEAVEDGLRGDRLSRAELLFGSLDRRVQALAIDIVERIAFLIVEAAKEAVHHLGPFLRGELQRLGDDLLSIGRHMTSLRSRDWLDKVQRG